MDRVTNGIIHGLLSEESYVVKRDRQSMKLHIRRCSELTRSMKTRCEEDRAGVHQMGVHQSLVLSFFMFNIVLGVLPLRISKWLSFVLAKGLAILADTMDELLFKLMNGKHLESKERSVNTAETKTMISGKTCIHLGILSNTLTKFDEKVLEVIQSFASDVSR